MKMIPIKEKYIIDKDGKTTSVTQYMHILPDTVDIKSQITPEVRYRGIYEAILYNTTLSIDGIFPRASLEDLRIPPENIEWSGAFISLGITDMRGIKDRIPDFRWCRDYPDYRIRQSDS